MIFVGGPANARDIPIEPGVSAYKVLVDGVTHVYARRRFSVAGIGWGDVMVHPVYQDTPHAFQEALRDVLLERWLQDG